MATIPDTKNVLKRLIQFDTTNPPGSEAECIVYIQGLLAEVGIESQLFEKVSGRPNLVARIKGRGDAAPLLLYGHVDVVTTTNQNWTHPPFAAEEADGYIWGRGALDMKGGVAMLVCAFLRAAADDLPGDVILCILSDEEAGGEAGAHFMVTEHPEVFDGVRHAIGEFGGFSLYMGGKRLTPIMVAEKQVCWMRATIRGTAGHASLPHRDGTMARLGQILTTLNNQRLPVHITPPVRMMLETMAEKFDDDIGKLYRQLLDPEVADSVLDQMGARGAMFDALLHNTVNATIVQGGDKINVIPGEITLQMDGRLLPGFGPDDLLNELGTLIGDDLEYSIIRYDPYPAMQSMGLFDLLSEILIEADPDGIPVPLVIFGATDGRHLARLGIQTYGYLPMPLPEDFNFLSTIHAADERIPVDALEFGTNVIYQVLQRFH